MPIYWTCDVHDIKKHLVNTNFLEFHSRTCNLIIQYLELKLKFTLKVMKLSAFYTVA